MKLGDAVHEAFAKVGVTPERVEAWLGRPCGCAARQEKLNQLGRWVTRVLSGKTENAKEHLENITQQGDLQ